ncbi:MAG: phage late control D family protein [Candidatus Tectimicrobiota bacterium]
MEFAAIAAESQHLYVPRYSVRVGGKELLGEGAEVVSLSVDEVLDGAGRVAVSVLNHDLRWLTSPLFVPGNAIEVQLGYSEPLETLFVGEISELRPSFPAEGPAQLEVAGHDLSHRLSRGCRFRPWEQVTDSDIARQIANDHHLDPAGISTTTVRYPKVMQDGEDDLTFLRRRAEKNQFEVAVRERTLIFAEPQDQSTAPEAMALKWGESLLTFIPEMNTATQVSDVTVRSWNPTAKREIVGRASWRDLWGNQPHRQSGGELVERLYGRIEACVRGEPVYTQEEADQRARAVLKERAGGLITGRGESIGLPQLRVRTLVRLDGLGPFSMQYYITATTHTLSAAGYRTTFSVKGETYARSH